MILPKTTAKIWNQKEQIDHGTFWYEADESGNEHVCECGSNKIIGSSRSIHCDKCGRVWMRDELEMRA